MKEYQVQITKLRKHAAECALIRDFAADKAKRKVFDRLSKHLAMLADQVTVAMLEQSRPIDTRADRSWRDLLIFYDRS